MPAKSQQQQKIMGLALSFKRGEVPASKVSQKVKDLAKSMTMKELEKYASTKRKGLPVKVKESASLSTFEQFMREKDDDEVDVDIEDMEGMDDVDVDIDDESGDEDALVHVTSTTPMRTTLGADAPEAHEPESKMMQYQLKNIIEKAEELIQLIEGMEYIEDWMQSKVTIADDYLSGLRDYVKHRS